MMRKARHREVKQLAFESPRESVAERRRRTQNSPSLGLSPRTPAPLCICGELETLSENVFDGFTGKEEFHTFLGAALLQVKSGEAYLSQL